MTSTQALITYYSTFYTAELLQAYGDPAASDTSRAVIADELRDRAARIPELVMV